MQILLLSFSGRKEPGNCLKILDYIEGIYQQAGHEVYKESVGHLDIQPCSGCNYECFSSTPCPKDDDVFDLYQQIINSDLVLMAIPVYSAAPPAIYFAWRERSQMVFTTEEMYHQYQQTPKGYIVIGNEQAGAREALWVITQEEKAHTSEEHFLLLQSSHFGQRSIAGNLISDPRVQKRVKTFGLELLDDTKKVFFRPKGGFFMKMQEFQEFLASRASHRKFVEEPVPEEDIRQIISCAGLAPSGHNFQPWKFVAIRNKDLISQMSAALEENLRSLYVQLPEDGAKKLEGYAFFIKHFENAPLVIAVFSRDYEYISTKLESKYGVELPETELFNMSLLGVGAAVNNLLLAAQTLGYGSCWMSEPVVYGQKDIEEILEVEEPYKFVSLVAVGKPTKERKGQPRKDVDKILTVLD